MRGERPDQERLQAATDLLLLGRPDGSESEALDDTGARIRSIATVHRLQKTARARNLRLAEVAARIVEQQELLAPKPRT